MSIFLVTQLCIKQEQRVALKDFKESKGVTIKTLKRGLNSVKQEIGVYLAEIEKTKPKLYRSHELVLKEFHLI